MKDKKTEEKRMMFFDIQEHPENYTDEQIEKLLADKEIKEFFHDMIMTKRAVKKQHPPKTDIEKAWKKFVKRPQIHRISWMKIAVSVIGILFLSGVALAGILQFRNFHSSTDKKQETDLVKTEQIQYKNKIKTEQHPGKDFVELKPVIFENVELNTILSTMKIFYHVKVTFKNKPASHIRLYFNWNKKESLQHNIDILNGFDQINITYSDSTICVE